MANTPVRVDQLPTKSPATVASLKTALGVDALSAQVQAIQVGQASNLVTYTTLAAMNADLSHPDGTPAWVTNDPTAANNQTYRKSGASGSGSWVATVDRLANFSNDLAATADATKGSGIVGHVTPLAASYLKYTSDMLNGMPVSVMIGIDRTKHAGILAGTNTDDLTSTIQALVSEMPGYGTLVFPRGVFHRGTLTIQDKTGFKIIGNGARHVLVGTNAYAFSPLGTVQDLEIAGHYISGDGTEASNHKGFYCASGQTLSGINVHHCTLEDLVNGISLNANTGGSISGGIIHNNVIRRVVGIASGYGYGIHVAKGSSDFVDTEIFSNWISFAQRHAIYIARGSSINCHHNTIIGHRSTLSSAQQADATDGWSKFRPAINVARSSHVRVEANICRNGYDGFILVSADPDAGGATLYDVTIRGNKGLFPQNAVPLYACGDSTPATTGVPENVEFAGNTGVSDGQNVDLIRHYSGKSVAYRGNRLVVKNVTTTVNAAEIRNTGEAAGGATYNQDLLWEGNDLYGTNGTGGTIRGLRVDTTVLTSGARVKVDQREAGGDIASPVIIAASVSNPAFRQVVGSGQVVGLYVAGDTSPTVARCVSQLIIANTAATSITTLDDADNGQTVTLKFSDANTTLVNSTSLRLQGGVNFVSTDRDTLVVERVSGAWYERSRSVN